LEDHVLSTLDRPVPLISMEFNFPHAYAPLATCLSNIAAQGNYEFNVAITEPPLRLELPRWVTAEEITKAVAENGWQYVELYARRI
jgi:hypothetical protein